MHQHENVIISILVWIVLIISSAVKACLGSLEGQNTNISIRISILFLNQWSGLIDSCRNINISCENSMLSSMPPPPPPPCGVGGGLGMGVGWERWAKMMIFLYDFQHFSIRIDASRQRSSFIRTEAREASRWEWSYFRRSFNTFWSSHQRSRLVGGAFKVKISIFPSEFKYLLLISGQSPSASPPPPRPPWARKC